MDTRTTSTVSAAFLVLLMEWGIVASYGRIHAKERSLDQALPDRSATLKQAPLCGKPNDRQVHIPPDWTSFVPPARGVSYVDPVFGCSIVRLTDALHDGVAEHHYYATLTPVSADDSKVLIVNEHGAWFVTDLVGRVVVPVTKMPANNGGTLLWDATNGDVFYYTIKNSLMKGTIQRGTVKASLIHRFGEYEVVMLPDKTDLSVDGESQAMWGGTTNGTHSLNIFTYNIQRKTKKTPYVTGCTQNAALTQGSCVHGITQTADNNVIIDFANDGACAECGNRLWDGNTLMHVQDRTNHLDTGYDLKREAIYVSVGNSMVMDGMKNPCPSGWGLDVRKMNDVSSAVCLLDHQPAWHVSYRGSASQPWAALSFFDDRKPGPELFNNNKRFQVPSSSNWQLYEDEIILARIDGGAIYRLAHARSRSAESYWSQPHAAISRDGKYIVFDSNMAYVQGGCPSGIADCSDVYLIMVQ